MAEDSEYEVGYGKPPRHTRWPPVQSGNPKGRPRKTTILGDLIREELDRLVEVREQGTTRKITKREALAKSLVNAALKDPRLAHRLLPLLSSNPETDIEIDEHDLATLDRFLQQEQTRRESPGEGEGET